MVSQIPAFRPRSVAARLRFADRNSRSQVFSGQSIWQLIV